MSRSKLYRRVVLSALFLTCCLNCIAQDFRAGNIYAGVKGGINMSRVFFTPNIQQSFIPGVNLGVTFRYIEESYFGLIAEVNFEQRGWKEDFDGAQFEYSRTLNYLQVPLLTHIYFGKDNRFFLNLGPEIGVMLGESTNSNFNYKDIEAVPDFPSKLRTTYQYQLEADNRIDYGISAGLGGEISAGPKNSIYVEGRGYYGLGNVLKSGRTELFKGSNSLSLMLSVGYWFRL